MDDSLLWVMKAVRKNESRQAPEYTVRTLLKSQTVTIRETYCPGLCRQQSDEEATSSTQLVFPYRGVYVRHLGEDLAVAEANQVLFFNAEEAYRISHPVAGGDSSLTLAIGEPQLRELAPPAFLRGGAKLEFRKQRSRIEARAQALLALLRHRLLNGTAEMLEAEILALTLVQRALGPRTSHARGASFARQRLVDRVKLVVAGESARRWTLAEIAAQVRCSPVYLTQVFQQVEGLPLYRYQLRLRLARALHLLPQFDDLTALAFELGFSSHSHFSAAFRAAYGRSPSQFRHCAGRQSDKNR
jgi:AraC family transcriptional regulator